MRLNVVLFEPEIPQNTGNIARTCAATGADLHLIHPLGFSVEDKYVRRAGLDYWNLLTIHHYDSWEDFREKNKEDRFYFATTKTDRPYSEARFEEGAYLIFGPESRGLPEALLREYADGNIRVPMVRDARSLNLSNTVAILVYEALRQNGFPGLFPGGS